MARIEEITALLADEIETFEKTVNKLAEQSTKLSQIELTVETGEFTQILKKFNNRLNLDQTNHEVKLNQILTAMSNSVRIPKWYMIANLVIVFLFLASVGYNIYQSNKIEVVALESYQEGEKLVKNHIIDFFKENPKAKKQYEKWKAK